MNPGILFDTNIPFPYTQNQNGWAQTKQMHVKGAVMKKHSYLWITLLILFLFSNTSFSTTIEFWTTQTQSDRVKTIQLLIDVFEALNEDIHVKLIPVDENEIPSQMAAASAAENLPTIIEGSSELLLAFGEEGILNTNIATDIIKKIGTERFFQGTLKMVEAGNPEHYYGVPYHGWVQGIWYRADWFKEEGLAPPDTWENILKAAKTFYKPEKNQYGILIGTKAENYTEQCFTHLAMSNNSAEFNADGELIFNSKETLKTLQFYADLAKFNPPGPQTWRARDYYLQGKLAMFFYSTYIMDDLALAEVAADSLTNDNFKELGKNSFDPQLVKNTKVITTISNTCSAGYETLIGLGSINHKESSKNTAAQKVVEYLYEPSSYIAFLHISPRGMNPVIKDIANNPDYLNDPKGIFNKYGKEKIKEIISGLENIGSFTTIDGKTFPESGIIFSKQIIPRMIYSVTIENKDPQEAIKWAETQMKQVIK